MPKAFFSRHIAKPLVCDLMRDHVFIAAITLDAFFGIKNRVGIFQAAEPGFRLYIG